MAGHKTGKEAQKMNRFYPTKYETIKEAGYKYLYYNKKSGVHTLLNLQTNKTEQFVASKYYAGWALIYKNTHLEFLGCGE